MRTNTKWTRQMLAEANALWQAGLTYEQVSEKIGQTSAAIEHALRRYGFNKRNVKPLSPEWTAEMDEIVLKHQNDMPATLLALEAIGGRKSRRSVSRRRLRLLGHYDERNEPDVTPLAAESLRSKVKKQSNAFIAAMIAAGYVQGEPSRQPGTRNPRFISPHDIAEFGAVFDRIPK